jgi:hypothetical protein
MKDVKAAANIMKRKQYREYVVGTSDFDAPMSGIKIRRPMIF